VVHSPAVTPATRILLPYKNNTFFNRWQNPEVDGDSSVLLTKGNRGQADTLHYKMQRLAWVLISITCYFKRQIVSDKFKNINYLLKS
jgi:hypothetical protein